MELVRKEMRVSEVLLAYPSTEEVFARFGMACATCQGAPVETVEVCARMASVEVTELLEALNRVAAQSRKDELD